MKKLLLFSLAVGVISCAFAQNKYAPFNKRNMKIKTSSVIDLKELPNIPFKPKPHIGAKVLSTRPIATSGNCYTLLDPVDNYIDVCPETNTVLVSFRQAGAWGGTSGKVWSKFSENSFLTWDSVSFLSNGTANLFRYPNGVIYNPIGNTDPNKLSAVVCGPSTDGGSWVASYLGSQKRDGTYSDMQEPPISPDTATFLNINLTSGNGNFHVAGKTSLSADEGNALYYTNYNGKYNVQNNAIDWTTNYIYNLWKPRVFSTANSAWTFGSNLTFAPDGLHGYFYTMGNDSLSSPYNTGIPIVWETFDGGTNWTKKNVCHHFDKIPAIIEHIWPIRSTLSLPVDQWVYRPNFPSGATTEEGSFPGVVDQFGNLHIAAVIEGMYSGDPDSLGYSYANHPRLLFDVYQEDTTWSAIFIDTLRSGPVPADVSGFGSGADALGWEHWIMMSKSPDGSKIFVSWTDTDPTIDSTNVMPEPKVWGFDVVSNAQTLVHTFPTGGNTFYYHTSDMTLYDGAVNRLPVTYIDIYEQNQNPLASTKHYFLDGIEIYDTAFVILNVKKNIACNSDMASQNYPNPSKGLTNINVKVSETSNVNLTITNMLGQKVFESVKSVSGTFNFAINTAGWSKGIYFYTVNTESKKETKKMIVE